MSDTAQRFDPASGEDFREAMATVFGNESLEPVGAGDAADTVTLDCIESSVGLLIAGATRDAIVQLEFCDRQTLERRLRTVRRRFTSPIVQGSNPWLQELAVQLSQYFDGKRREFQLPLRYPGTPFQERVWDTLLEIPYGRTWSYLDMAVRIGDIKATRAVGTANGTNPIAIVIPCHRVINASGELGGYGGGLWRKRILLDLEMGQQGLF